jgi:membrane fusion protein, heavy metal efflux system
MQRDAGFASVLVVTPTQPNERTPRSRGVAFYAAVGTLIIAVLGAGGTLLFNRGRHKGGKGTTGRDVPRMEGGAITFSPAFKSRAGVAFTAAERAPFKPTVRVVGAAAFNPTYVAAIGTRLRGTVRRTFKYEGDHVKAGEPLAEVESAELGEAQSNAAKAQTSFNTAEVQARREKDLLEKSLTTAREEEIAARELANYGAGLKAAQQRVRSFGGDGTFGLFIVRSPIAGHVVERHLAPGQSVDGNAIGYKVADLAHLWIELSVFERDLGFVRIDDDVDVSPLSEPDVKITGKVAHVGEVIDPKTRSTDVRVAVDHPKYHLRPGQSVHAVITSGTVERDAVLIPHTAVVYVDGRPTVFVAEGETHARTVTVRLGASDGTRHEVLAGIQPGQLVASAGVFALKSELFR